MSETKKSSADIKKPSSSVPFNALKPERILSLIEQALIEGLRGQGFEVALAMLTLRKGLDASNGLCWCSVGQRRMVMNPQEPGHGSEACLMPGMWKEPVTTMERSKSWRK